MNHRARLTLLAVVVAAACKDPVGVKSDILRVRSQPGELLLTNTSQQSVYFFAAERQLLTLADLAPPCADPLSCEGITQGDTRVLLNDQITGYHEGAEEAMIFHWHLVPDGQSSTGYRPDSIRVLAVRFAH
jgi:hypothetical protein